MGDLTINTVLIFLLILAGIWAVTELALTLRKTRSTIDELAHSATEAIDQATPVIAKLDGLMDELEPAVKEATPVMDKTSVLLDEVNDGMTSLNGILTDVGSATHGIAGIGDSASRIVNTATNAAVGVVSKVASKGGINIPEGQHLISKGKDADEAEAAEAEAAPVEETEEPKDPDAGYVTYKPVTADGATELSE